MLKMLGLDAAMHAVQLMGFVTFAIGAVLATYFDRWRASRISSS